MKIQKYLSQSPIFALNAAYEAIIPKINRELKNEKLNLLQGLVLTALFFEGKDDISPSQLAQIFQTSRGNMSHILSDLECRGFVKRVVSETDARQFKIILKTEGRKQAMALIRYYDRIQGLFEKELGAVHCQKAVDGLFALQQTFQKRKF